MRGAGGGMDADRQTQPTSPREQACRRVAKGVPISSACTSALFTTRQSRAVIVPFSGSPALREPCRRSIFYTVTLLYSLIPRQDGGIRIQGPRCAAMRCDAVGGFPFSKGKSRLLQLPDVACLPVQLLRLVAINGVHRPLLSHPTANKARCLDRRICLSRVTASSLSTMGVFLKNIISKGGSCLQVDGKPPNDG